MIPLAVFLLVFQASVMLVDELHFHRRRGLPRWERIGHPLDTGTVLACYATAIVLPWNAQSLAVYVGLAAFSCLFVTKDEFVHARACSPAEHWLHAVLFVLHPLVLAGAALLWREGARSILLVQAALTLAFALYQLIYWNVAWQRLSRSQ